MTQKQFIRVQKERYRISDIKRYTAKDSSGIKTKSFAIYIYFTLPGSSGSIHHNFESEEVRDKVLSELDEALQKQIVLIQDERYKMSNIKRYSPDEREDLESTPYLVYLYFTLPGNSSRIYHRFDTKLERDEILTKLDEAFGV